MGIPTAASKSNVEKSQRPYSGVTSKAMKVNVGDRSLSLSNLDKVLYPSVGFTKAQIVDYYARIAPIMVPHLAGRCITMLRFPDGTAGKSFYEKRCPTHRPEWVPTAQGPGNHGDEIAYCLIGEPAALVWLANLAALEVHSPMAKAADLLNPTMVVFDLDPGAPATITQCCEVALLLKQTFEMLGLKSYAKTSGSKGLQVYLPVNGACSHRQASHFALAVAKIVRQASPQLVIVEMAKAIRKGKIFIDWSQNSRHKTTIAPYSLRGRDRPTVSTPVSWDEVKSGAGGAPLAFEAADVLSRTSDEGDLFGETLTVVQELPELA